GRLDAVALAYLLWPDARQLRDAANRLEYRRAVACELERVAVGGRDQRLAAALLLERDRGSEEVVGLVPGCLRVAEAERPDEHGQQVELFEQLLVEDAAALVPGERFVPVRRHVERVPADDHGARRFAVPQPQEHVREPDDRVPGPPPCASNRLRQRVISAVR